MKKQLINNVTLIGRVYQHTLENKISKKGVNYIGGKIDLATDDAGLNIVTVEYTYVAPTYPAKDDKPERPNPNFAVLQKLIDSGKTVVTDGAAEATKLKLTPSFSSNSFVHNGEMVEAKRIDGGFVSSISVLPEEKDRNKFEADVLINKTNMVEADGEKVKEPYLEIKGFVFNWAKALQPVDFVVKSEGGIRYFESLGASKENPIFTKVWGQITSTTVMIKKEEESAFGAPSVKEYPRTTKHWEITGAASEPYPIDEEGGISVEEIKKAIEDRKRVLEDVRKNAEEYAASKNVTAATSTPSAATPAAAGNFIW